MAALLDSDVLDSDVLRAQAASAAVLTTLTSDRSRRPLPAACWVITPDHRLACSWYAGTPDLEPLSG